MDRLASRYPKMAEIVIKKHKEGKTYEEIGKDYGNIGQNIEKLEKKAMKILKGILFGRVKSDLSIPKQRKTKKPTKNSESNPEQQIE